MESFERVAARGKETLYFKGAPGIGKSKLINEIHKPITQKRGFFISGKYDQFKRAVPYSAHIQAFQELIDLLITENEEQTNRWKERILAAVGKNGQVLIDILPSMEMLVGPQPAVEQLPAAEAQNRFRLVFQRFIKVFARPEHPLVLFIDDLQWADQAGLKLLEELLVDNELEHFLFIGAYRDNEVSETDPLNFMLKNLAQHGIESQNVTLAPLREAAVGELIGDTLGRAIEEVEPLAGVIHRKTEGNPFFVNELLKELHGEKLIRFDGGWQWEMAAIAETDITDNVVELMARRIASFDAQVIETLRVAACVGMKIYLDTVGLVSQKSEPEIFTELKPAINEGMILVLDDHYRFAHDRVREAVYSRIPEGDKVRMHYEIGKSLMADRVGDRLFSIVNHLNRGRSLLTAADRELLIELGRQAGQKAKESAAFDPAFNFFGIAVEMLPEDGWQSHYESALDLHSEMVESAFFAGNEQAYNHHWGIVDERAATTLDKVKIYDIKILQLLTDNNPKAAIDASLDYLAQLGVAFPKRINKLTVLLEYVKTKRMLDRFSMEELIDLPDTAPPEIVAAKQIMDRMSIAAYYSSRFLLAITASKWLRLNMQYGNGGRSYPPYVGFSTLLVTAFGKISYGCELASVAQALVDKSDDRVARPRVTQFYTALFEILKKSIKSCCETYHETYLQALEVGDLETAGSCAFTYANFAIYSGSELNALDQELAAYERDLFKLKQEFALAVVNVFRQTVLNLLGKYDKDRCQLIGESLDEEQMVETFEKIDHAGALLALYLGKMCLAYTFGRHADVLEYAAASAAYHEKFSLSLLFPQYLFYKSLSQLALIGKGEIPRRKGLKAVNKESLVLRQWAEQAPDNYLHKVHLIDAELARVRGDKSEALGMYHRAAEAAKSVGFINEEALTCEAAAHFCRQENLTDVARMYMTRAHYSFTRWGAREKAEQLAETYPALISQVSRSGAGDDDPVGQTSVAFGIRSTVSTGSATFSGTGLDLNTILKSSQTISSEIEMDHLLNKMMSIVIENAGAQKGAFLLSEAGGLVVKVVADGSDFRLQSTPLEESPDLSQAIVRYAVKTGNRVVLDNAGEDGRFAKDNYIGRHDIKSVICSPLMKQGELTGVIYLENNLSDKVFTPARLELLNTLSAQIAISVENSLLISEMKEKEQLKKEMQIAREIQTSLCPTIPKHDEFEIAATMRPADEVGGDYFDIAYDKQGDFWLAIGDVTGHGVTAGMIMMMAETAFNICTTEEVAHTLKEVIQKMNAVLHENIANRLHDTHFMTMCVLKYLGGGAFSFAGAHVDIIVYRAAARACEFIPTKGLFLGILPDVEATTQMNQFQMEQGDVLVLYTDGIIEAKQPGPELKMLAREGLARIIADNAQRSVDDIQAAILDETLAWCDHQPEDDLTMIVVKKK